MVDAHDIDNSLSQDLGGDPSEEHIFFGNGPEKKAQKGCPRSRRNTGSRDM